MNCPFCNKPLLVSKLGIVWCPKDGVIAEFLMIYGGGKE